MEDVRLRIAYKKLHRYRMVQFMILQADYRDDACLEAKRVAFSLSHHYHVKGAVWQEGLGRLQAAALGTAEINGRKNVCPTTADEGVLC